MIFDSLLWVIDPKEWAAPIGDREYWTRTKTNRARYLLDQPTPSLDHDPPTLDRLLAAAIKANANGGINWMIINRVIGKRVDHTGSGSTLALLVAAGVVSKVGHWQDFHPVTGDAVQTIELLASKRERDGKLDWMDPEGQEIAGLCRQQLEKQELGWIDPNAFDALLDSLCHQGGALPTTGARDSQANPDSLTEALAEMRRKRREKVLHELGKKYLSDLEGA